MAVFNVPGMDTQIAVGDPTKEWPNWHDYVDSLPEYFEAADNDDDGPTPADVIAVLGFDPDTVWPDDELELGDVAGHDFHGNQWTGWHGSPSGDLRGSAHGLHVGTREAAKQALEARIGVPASGEWDGTREYGKTFLAGNKTLKKLDPRGFNKTGYNVDAPDEDYYPRGDAAYSDRTKVPLTVKPDIFPVAIVGPMTNTPQNPHGDFKANALMAGQIKKGKAKRGYFYKEEGEDTGSIAAVVPNGQHLKRLDTKLSLNIPIELAFPSYVRKQMHDRSTVNRERLAAQSALGKKQSTEANKPAGSAPEGKRWVTWHGTYILINDTGAPEHEDITKDRVAKATKSNSSIQTRLQHKDHVSAEDYANSAARNKDAAEAHKLSAEQTVGGVKAAHTRMANEFGQRAEKHQARAVDIANDASDYAAKSSDYVASKEKEIVGDESQATRSATLAKIHGTAELRQLIAAKEQRAVGNNAKATQHEVKALEHRGKKIEQEKNVKGYNTATTFMPHESQSKRAHESSLDIVKREKWDAPKLNKDAATAHKKAMEQIFDADRMRGIQRSQAELSKMDVDSTYHAGMRDAHTILADKKATPEAKAKAKDYVISHTKARNPRLRLSIDIPIALTGNPNHDELGRFASGDSSVDIHKLFSIKKLDALPITDNASKAIFFKPDGKMVDGSEGNDTRTLGHSLAAGGALGLNEATKNGYIRWQPETNTIELGKEPTVEQYSLIHGVIADRTSSKGFTLELNNKHVEGVSGNVRRYNKGVEPAVILKDIKSFYKSKSVNSNSLVQQFHVPVELGDVAGHEFHGNQWTGHRLAKLATTTDINKGGFIRPDGKLVNLHRDRSGKGSEEHAEAAAGDSIEINSADDAEMERLAAKMNEKLDEAKSLGFIRFDNSTGTFDMATEPTDKQYKLIDKTIRAIANKSVKDVGGVIGEFDLYDGKQYTHFFVKRNEVDTVIPKIKQFYKTGKKPYKSPLQLGDVAGHEFHGNQWTNGAGSKQVETPAFKKWFGDSKVINDDGSPKVVYHGTTKDFHEFDFDKLGEADHPSAMLGFYFVADPKQTEDFSGSTGVVKPCYLKIENPVVMTANEWAEELDFWRGVKGGTKSGGGADYDRSADHFKQFADDLQNKYNCDGVIIKADKTGETHYPELASDNYVIFKPEQVKSATGNKGTFDPKSKDITASLDISLGDVAGHTFHGNQFIDYPNWRGSQHDAEHAANNANDVVREAYNNGWVSGNNYHKAIITSDVAHELSTTAINESKNVASLISKGKSTARIIAAHNAAGKAYDHATRAHFNARDDYLTGGNRQIAKAHGDAADMLGRASINHYAEARRLKKLAKPFVFFSLAMSSADIDEAAKETDVNASQAQLEAGNYRKGRTNIQGLQIAIESPKGSIRRGKHWQQLMANHYGYIVNHPRSDADGDHVDIFTGDHPENNFVHVIDQVKPNTGEWDEHKVVLGANSEDEAKQIYHNNYKPGWKGYAGVTTLPMDRFKEWLKSGDTKRPISSQALGVPKKQVGLAVPLTVNTSIQDLGAKLVPISLGTSPIKAIQAVGKWLAEHKNPGPMPGYGQIFIKEDGSGETYYCGGDGDDDGFEKLVREKLLAIDGIDEVKYEAESYPPRDGTWLQVYPNKRKWIYVGELSLTQGGWVGVDLDGCLAYQDDFKPFDPNFIGDPVWPMVARVKIMLASGKDVRIFTARVAGPTVSKSVEKQKALIEAWCQKYLGQVLPITAIKDPTCEEIWDDRARRVVHNTGLVLAGNPYHDDLGRFASGEGGTATLEKPETRYGGWKPNWNKHPSKEQFITARNKTKRPGFLSPLAPDDIKDHTLLLSRDGKVGGAVSPDGDMQNVFNNDGPKGAGCEILLEQIKHGGNHLDCFDGHLPDLYSQFGFVETGRMRFNTEYAPPSWDYNKYDNPDVVFMALKPTGETDNELRNRVLGPKANWHEHTETAKYYDDYDKAKADSRRAGRIRSSSQSQESGVGGSAHRLDSGSSARDRDNLTIPISIGGAVKKAIKELFNTDANKIGGRDLSNILEDELSLDIPIELADITGGVWRTIRGAPVFIKDGQSVGDAIKEHFGRDSAVNKSNQPAKNQKTFWEDQEASWPSDQRMLASESKTAVAYCGILLADAIAKGETIDSKKSFNDLSDVDQNTVFTKYYDDNIAKYLKQGEYEWHQEVYNRAKDVVQGDRDFAFNLLKTFFDKEGIIMTNPEKVKDDMYMPAGYNSISLGHFAVEHLRFPDLDNSKEHTRQNADDYNRWWRQQQEKWNSIVGKFQSQYNIAANKDIQSIVKDEIINPDTGLPKALPAKYDSEARQTVRSIWESTSLEYKTAEAVAVGILDNTPKKLEEPHYYSPITSTSYTWDYEKTQAVARYLQTKLQEEEWASDPVIKAAGISKDMIADVNEEIWGDWKSSSTSEAGVALQKSAADQLHGMFRGWNKGSNNKVDDGYMNVGMTALGTAADGNEAFVTRDKAIALGKAIVDAHVRATWAASQFVLSKANVDNLNVFRAVGLPQDVIDEQKKEQWPIGDLPGVSRGYNGSYTKLPAIQLLRNGAASTTAKPSVANNWGSASGERVVLRIDAPKEAVLSLPCFGQNVTEEQEVVLAGTWWNKWDAWEDKAPDTKTVPFKTAA